ncbi:hypothetical protein CLAFUW4_00184, partial [Fulvia fulva]
MYKTHSVFSVTSHSAKASKSANATSQMSDMSTSEATSGIDWNKYPLMRLTIRLLHEDFPNMSATERIKIFNAIFTYELIAECGFEDGITDKNWETIATEWRGRNKSKNKASWDEITKWPRIGEEGERFKQLREQVHEQAKEMGHVFLPVYNSNDGVGAVAGRGIRVPIKTKQSVQDESSSEDEVEQKQKPKKKKKKKKKKK